MSSNDPYPEGATTRDTDPYAGDDPAADEDSDVTENAYGWRMGWGWLPVNSPDTEAVTGDENAYETDDDAWLGEGVATLLLVVGLALFLFPEPASSGLGIFLMLGGIIVWLVEAL